MTRLALVVAVGILLSGCGSLSGIGGSGQYACTAPEGVSCMSVTGLNANVTTRSLPGLQPRADQAQIKTGDKQTGVESKPEEQLAYGGARMATEGKVSPSHMDAPYSGQPIRTPPRVLRIWVAPFEDAEADLHDQKYLYVTVHTGRWVLEANQVNVQRQFRQISPLGKVDEEQGAERAVGQAGAGPTDRSAAFSGRTPERAPQQQKEE
jgi:conjugal transfer pilus assembly protein TraV